MNPDQFEIELLPGVHYTSGAVIKVNGRQYITEYTGEKWVAKLDKRNRHERRKWKKTFGKPDFTKRPDQSQGNVHFGPDILRR